MRIAMQLPFSIQGSLCILFCYNFIYTARKGAV